MCLPLFLIKVPHTVIEMWKNVYQYLKALQFKDMSASNIFSFKTPPGRFKLGQRVKMDDQKHRGQNMIL